MKRLLIGILLVLPAIAQKEPPSAPPKEPADNPVNEQYELQRALGEAGGSPSEFIRVLETHLKKFPKSEQRAELERAIFKGAIEAKDSARIIAYGEKLVAADQPDLETMDRYSRTLLSVESKERAEKALAIGKRLEERLLTNDTNANGSPEKRFRSAREHARFREEMDRSLSRALMTEAKASGILGRNEDAVDMAKRAFNTYPSAEAAHELARWQIASGRPQDALASLADAFTLADVKALDERNADRKKMAEIYTKLKGSEAGMGDLLLQSYDRMYASVIQRRQMIREIDPNANLTDPLEFTLSGVKGDRLALSSLKGKVVILDFWATWCGPCRAQYPIYEEVKKRYKDRNDVIFLAINTDEDRDAVEPFLKAQKWNKSVYFEDGLSNLLRVSSIPTTIIFGRDGSVATRMNGFLPERFKEMLTERIEAALGGGGGQSE